MTDAPTLEPWQAQLGDLRLGPGTPYEWVELEGADELPGLRTDDVARPWAHGDFDGDDWAEARVLAFTVEIAAEDSVTYDQALADLRRVMVPTRGTVPFWLYLPRRGAPLRWDVKVRRHRITTDLAYEMGLAEAQAQLYASDPLGYGAVQCVDTPYPAPAGGLEFDLFAGGVLEFGEPGSTGRVVLTNPGTADVSYLARVDGPVDGRGFEIVDIPTGRRLRYAAAVPAGTYVEIDTATGSVRLDGTADRSGLLTLRQWTPVPASGSTELAFLPLGAATAATLTVTYSPGWW